MSDELLPPITFTTEESIALGTLVCEATLAGLVRQLAPTAGGPRFALALRRATAKFMDAHSKAMGDSEAKKLTAAARAADDQLEAEIRGREAA
jgi:hypothetical protein